MLNALYEWANARRAAFMGAQVIEHATVRMGSNQIVKTKRSLPMCYETSMQTNF